MKGTSISRASWRDSSHPVAVYMLAISGENQLFESRDLVVSELDTPVCSHALDELVRDLVDNKTSFSSVQMMLLSKLAPSVMPRAAAAMSAVSSHDGWVSWTCADADLARVHRRLDHGPSPVTTIIRTPGKCISS